MLCSTATPAHPSPGSPRSSGRDCGSMWTVRTKHTAQPVESAPPTRNIRKPHTHPRRRRGRGTPTGPILMMPFGAIGVKRVGVRKRRQPSKVHEPPRVHDGCQGPTIWALPSLATEDKRSPCRAWRTPLASPLSWRLWFGVASCKIHDERLHVACRLRDHQQSVPALSPTSCHVSAPFPASTA